MRSLRNLLIFTALLQTQAWSQSNWTLTPVFDSILDISMRNDTLWLATQNAGLVYFSVLSGVAGHIDPGNSSLGEKDIRSVCSTADAIYAGGNSTGFYRIRGTEILHFDSLNSPLPGNSVTSIIQDPISDTMYIATNNGLVQRIDDTWIVSDSTNSGITANVLTKLFFDAEHILWIATRYHGVSSFDGSTFTNYNFDNAGLNDNWVKCIAEDSAGYLYFADYLGVDKYDPQSDDWLFVFNTFTAPMQSSKVNSMVFDERGDLWFATHGGITKADFDGYWENFNAENAPFRNAISDALYYDAERDVIWAGTFGGLLAYHPGGAFLPDYTAPLHVYPSPCSDILHMEITGDPRIRIFSANGQEVIHTHIQTGISGVYTASLSVTDLAPGLYFIEVAGEDNLVAKFIKK